ncbi:MAG TPA: hypothetical protein VKM55_04205 [Candidatus Lokiarchaeia archaeon]|nr:hypothetical protein [Candidatus Lokiarchaeia archaeon]
MSEHDPNGDMVTKDENDVEDSRNDGYEFQPTPLQERILGIARQLMQKHYVLDSVKLYYACAREIKESDNVDVMRAIDDLIRHKVLFPGKATSREGVLANTCRKKILDTIKAEPGIYFSKVRETIGIDSNTLMWHLKMLEKFDFIRQEKFGNSTVFFEKFQDKDLDLLHYYMHKDSSIDIFKQVITHPGLSFQDLLHFLDLPRTTLVRKLKALIENGLIAVNYTMNRITSIDIPSNLKEPCLKFLYNVYWQEKPT